MLRISEFYDGNKLVGIMKEDGFEGGFGGLILKGYGDCDISKFVSWCSDFKSGCYYKTHNSWLRYFLLKYRWYRVGRLTFWELLLDY